MNMNAVGIDVSKGKSMVAILRPYGEIISKPFEVKHTVSGIRSLIEQIQSIDGESRIVMEHTGRYYEPLVRELSKADLFVSAINPKLIKDFGDTEVSIFSAPGRSEVGGNHTDHQHGQVLAASINLDAIAIVAKTSDDKIQVISDGYDLITIDASDLSLVESEKETTTALIKGVAAGAVKG